MNKRTDPANKGKPILRVTFAIPDLTGLNDQFSHFWLNHIFVGALTDNYAVAGMAFTYVRMVEAAIVEYGMASERIRKSYGTRDGIAIGAINRAISHLESCIGDMHRARNAFGRL